MSLNPTEWDMIKSHLDRIEEKQDKTDSNITDLKIQVNDIIKTCAIVMPEEKIREIAKEEIDKSGPFNFGLSKTQIGLFITFLGGILTAIATFINNISK